ELRPDGSLISASSDTRSHDSFQYPAWILGVDYQATEDLFLYAKTGRASMAGGFNTRGTPPGLESYDPEELTDVELGMKMDSLDGRLRTNRSEEHTSELQSRENLVCRLLLEKKKVTELLPGTLATG